MQIKTLIVTVIAPTILLLAEASENTVGNN